MAHAYLTEKQMPSTFWFYAITHAAHMMNTIPGKHKGRLASPFILVHGVAFDKEHGSHFLLCVIFITRKMVKHQAHTIDRVIIGCSPTSNALLVYNP